MIMLDVLLLLFVSILTSFGLGGGNFYLLYLTFYKGVNQLEAQGKILFFYLPCALLSVCIYAYKKLLSYSVVVPMALGGLLGALLGSLLLPFLPTKWIKSIFAIVLLHQGIKMFFSKKRI